jgi:hypothetical protein
VPGETSAPDGATEPADARTAAAGDVVPATDDVPEADRAGADLPGADLPEGEQPEAAREADQPDR